VPSIHSYSIRKREAARNESMSNEEFKLNKQLIQEIKQKKKERSLAKMSEIRDL
jgi:hypothetical protein